MRNRWLCGINLVNSRVGNVVCLALLVLEVTVMGRLKPIFRFRIAFLLALTTIACGTLGYIKWQSSRVAEYCALVDSVGGTVVFDYMIDEDGNPIPTPKHPMPAGVRAVFGEFAFVTPTQLQLSDKRITDETVDRLSTHALAKEITDIQLVEASVTDEVMPALVRFPSLLYITLERTAITGEDLGRLAELPHLLELDISDTAVGGNAVSELSAIKGLRALLAFNTQLTSGDIERLREQLPRCKMIYDYATSLL